MSQVLPLLMWAVIVGQLLLGIALAGQAAKVWERGFIEDYEMEVCGRYLAMEANFHAAVTIWREMGCSGEEGDVDADVEGLLGDWRERYAEMNPESCAEAGPLRVRLHRERNADLDADYPNWVVRYE